MRKPAVSALAALRRAMISDARSGVRYSSESRCRIQAADGSTWVEAQLRCSAYVTNVRCKTRAPWCRATSTELSELKESTTSTESANAFADAMHGPRVAAES